MPNFHKPKRMCVVCRERFFQAQLHRFALIDEKIVPNPKNARSFYLCQICIKKDEKTLKKPLAKFTKNSLNLKEIMINAKD